MSGDIIQLNPEAFQTELKGLVKNSIEETLNAMLDEEAKKLVNAERYALQMSSTFLPLMAKSPYHPQVTSPWIVPIYSSMKIRRFIPAPRTAPQRHPQISWFRPIIVPMVCR